MVPKKQFEGWLRHQLFINIDEGHCSKLILKHVTSASRAGHTVMTIDVNLEEVDDNWIADTLKLLEETAEADASGIGGTQSYVIFAYHGGTTEKPSARFSIKMQGDANPEDDEVSSEPANGKGLLAQMMRHTEAIMRTSALSQSTVMNAMQRTLQQQSTQIEKLIDEKFSNISVVEQLLSQKNERDLEAMKATRSLEMKEKAFDTLKMVAPTVMNRLLTSGSPQAVATPQAISSRDLQLASLADTMTGEQLEKLQQVFTPEQLMLFIDVFSQIKRQQEVLEAAKET